MPYYKLCTVLIVLAAIWFAISLDSTAWLFVAIVVAISLIPELLVAAFGYTFAALCYLIKKLPGGNDRKDCRF